MARRKRAGRADVRGGHTQARTTAWSFARQTVCRLRHVDQDASMHPLPEVIRTRRLLMRRPEVADTDAIFPSCAHDAHSLASAALDADGGLRVQAACDTGNIPLKRALEESGFTRERGPERYAVHPNIAAHPRVCFMYARCRSRENALTASFHRAGVVGPASAAHAIWRSHAMNVTRRHTLDAELKRFHNPRADKMKKLVVAADQIDRGDT